MCIDVVGKKIYLEMSAGHGDTIFAHIDRKDSIVYAC